MSDALDTFRAIADPSPALSHKFGVFFFHFGIIPNPIDFRFQKVSGLSTEVQLETVNEGGKNLHSHRLPKKITQNNLVLERGHSTSLIPSPVNIAFMDSFSNFQFNACDVLITMFSDVLGVPVPVGAWLFMKAYPVRWSIGDFDAQSSSVLVHTMELAYTRFQVVGI